MCFRKKRKRKRRKRKKIAKRFIKQRIAAFSVNLIEYKNTIPHIYHKVMYTFIAVTLLFKYSEYVQDCQPPMMLSRFERLFGVCDSNAIVFVLEVVAFAITVRKR